MDQKSASTKFCAGLLNFMEGSSMVGAADLWQHDLLEHINKTKKMLEEIEMQREQKEIIKGENNSTADKKHKMSNLKREIVENKLIKATLQQT